MKKTFDNAFFAKFRGELSFSADELYGITKFLVLLNIPLRAVDGDEHNGAAILPGTVLNGNVLKAIVEQAFEHTELDLAEWLLMADGAMLFLDYIHGLARELHVVASKETGSVEAMEALKLMAKAVGESLDGEEMPPEIR